MYQCLNGAIPWRKCSIKVLAKWINYVYVLTEICHQRGKWLGPWLTDAYIWPLRYWIIVCIFSAVFSMLQLCTMHIYAREIVILYVYQYHERDINRNMLIYSNSYSPFRLQSFTSLMADLGQDISKVSSFSRCLNGTFPWRNWSVKTLID